MRLNMLIMIISNINRVGAMINMILTCTSTSTLNYGVYWCPCNMNLMFYSRIALYLLFHR